MQSRLKRWLRWVLILICCAGAGILLVQWRISQSPDGGKEPLVHQDEPAAPATEAPVVNVSTDSSEHRELLRLRNEVRQLREQVATTNNLSPPFTPGARGIPERIAPGPHPEMRQLGFAASRGDAAALDKLAELATAAIKARTNEHEFVLGEVKVAFDILASDAGQGSEGALLALWRATRMGHLQGLAIRALGEAAAMGNQSALDPLLDPERYLLTRASTVSALKPAADAGNTRAIDALAAVANDPKSQALWYMTANGLEKAALAGNATAIDALAVIGRSENPNSRRAALLALENAAFQQHPRAVEALRGLGYK